MTKKYQKVTKNIVTNTAKVAINTGTRTATGLFGFLRAVGEGMIEGARQSDAAPLIEKISTAMGGLTEDVEETK